MGEKSWGKVIVEIIGCVAAICTILLFINNKTLVEYIKGTQEVPEITDDETEGDESTDSGETEDGTSSGLPGDDLGFEINLPDSSGLLFINGFDYYVDGSSVRNPEKENQQLNITLSVLDQNLYGKQVVILRPNGSIGVVLTKEYTEPIKFTCLSGIYEIQVFYEGQIENGYKEIVEFNNDGEYVIAQ